jgi:hypothetical protein
LIAHIAFLQQLEAAGVKAFSRFYEDANGKGKLQTIVKSTPVFKTDFTISSPVRLSESP